MTMPEQIGRYQLQQVIGGGGAATVYLAHDPMLRRDVALKLVHPHLLQDEQAVRRLQWEGRAIVRLDHPHIPRAFDLLDRRNGQRSLALVYEYIEGHTLREHLKERDDVSPLAETLHIISAVAAALDHAHETGIVHHDVKPANIILTSDKRVYLVDFGLAWRADADPLTLDKQVLGTPEYMSPEQAQGQRGDHRSDIYSLGVIAYEMLTGSVPYSSETPHGALMLIVNADLPERLLEQVPEAVREVVRRCLAKRPSDRYATAGDFAKALEQATVTAAAVGDESITMGMSPRGEAVADIHSALLKGQHVLLAGATALGKSRVLGQIAAGRDHV